MSTPDWYQKRRYQSNVDPKFTLAVFKHASTQQAHLYLIPILDFELGIFMKIFEWLIDPNGINNNYIPKHPHPTAINNYT